MCILGVIINSSGFWNEVNVESDGDKTGQINKDYF